MDLLLREVTPREERHIPILADIVVGHDEGAKTEMARATVWTTTAIGGRRVRGWDAGS